MLVTWLRRRRRGSQQPVSASHRKPAPRKFSLETLEDRLAPAVAPLVASSFFDSAVYELNPSTGAVIHTLVAPNSQATLQGPAGMTVGPDGNLYFSSQFNNSIVQYNVATNNLSTFIPSGVLNPIASANGDASFSPAGLRFGPDGNLYVSLNGGRSAKSGGAVVRFDINNSGGVLSYGGTTATIATGLVQPTELTFGTSPGDLNTLYVSNSGVGNVVKITHADGASPTSSVFIAAGSGGLNYPSGLTWGGDGKLYVTDLGATSLQGQVLRYKANGAFDKVFTQPPSALQFQFPSDVAFTAGGDLLTADLGPTYPPSFGGPGTSGAILDFSAAGSFRKDLTATSFPANSKTGVTNFSPSQLALNVGDRAPAANAGGPYLVTKGESLTLNAGASTDPNGAKLTYSWDINGDGTFGDLTGVSPTLTWSQLVSRGLVTANGSASTFQIRVAARDSFGQVAFSAPVTLTIDPDPVVASSFFDSAVYEFDPTTGALLKTLVAPNSQATLEGPAGMAVGPDGNLYFSSQFNNSIVQYDVATGNLSTFIPSSVLNPIATAHGDTTFAPAGLRFGPDGNLYVSLNGGQQATSEGAVVRFDITNTAGVLSYGGTAKTILTGLVEPTGLAFGVSPNDLTTLYVSNSGSSVPGKAYSSTPHDVIRINNATGATPTSSVFIATNTRRLNYPSGLTWGRDGELYVTDLGATSLQGQVLRYKANGAFDEVFTQPPSALQFQFPSDVAFTAGGDLLTADLGPTYPASLGGPGTSGAILDFSAAGSFRKDLTANSFPADPKTSVTNFSPSQLTLNVGDVAPTAHAGGPYSINEGGSLTLNAGAAPDPNGGTLTYSWDVNGDGKFGDATGARPTLSWSQLRALGIHDNGTYHVRVIVSDSFGQVVTSEATTLTVHHVHPVLDISGAAGVNPGVAYTLNLSGREPVAGHTISQWTISWGDGTTSVIHGNPMTATHTYTGGPHHYTIHATAKDDVGTYAAAKTVAVDVTALHISGDATVNEAATYTLTLASHETAGHTISKWTITWGDGTSTTTTGNPGSVTHVFASGPHTYTVSATATDNLGTFNAGDTVTVNVKHVAPDLTLSGAATVNAGATYTLNLSSSEVGGHSLQYWTVNWGDGGPAEMVDAGALATHHVYASGPHNYTISATAADDVGTYSADNTVRVSVG
jgi:hypothetical protein